MEILPKPTKKYSSDNGSTAVEVAIKVALQYFFNKGKKTTIIPIAWQQWKFFFCRSKVCLSI
jgi:adenosylmethionine-8-amino-7-oxononanoate aminotransferase